MPKIKNKIIRILLIVGILIFISGGVLVYAIYKESTQYGYYNWNNNGEFPVIKKPAIYLYPKERTKISIKIAINGSITKSEPDYNNGWNVVADPNGIINGKYDYLFYEAQLKNQSVPKEGWVVKFSDLENWFNKYLPKLGFNIKETNQFKDYWLKELPESNYYQIKLMAEQFLEDNMNLIISPKPDSIIRRIFYFKPMQSETILIEPQIYAERKGFTVVEWGGLVEAK